MHKILFSFDTLNCWKWTVYRLNWSYPPSGRSLGSTLRLKRRTLFIALAQTLMLGQLNDEVLISKGSAIFSSPTHIICHQCVDRKSDYYSKLLSFYSLSLSLSLSLFLSLSSLSLPLSLFLSLSFFSLSLSLTHLLAYCDIPKKTSRVCPVQESQRHGRLMKTTSSRQAQPFLILIGVRNQTCQTGQQ